LKCIAPHLHGREFGIPFQCTHDDFPSEKFSLSIPIEFCAQLPRLRERGRPGCPICSGARPSSAAHVGGVEDAHARGIVFCESVQNRSDAHPLACASTPECLRAEFSE
jgi:hypothetical protein